MANLQNGHKTEGNAPHKAVAVSNLHSLQNWWTWLSQTNSGTPMGLSNSIEQETLLSFFKSLYYANLL